MVLDHADGEVARLTLTESALGEWLDVVVDTIVHTTLMLALGVAASRLAGASHLTGVVAAVGIGVERHHRQALAPGPGRRAARTCSIASTSRDGFYIMLSLFVVLALSRPTLLPGSLIVVAAVSSHVYWVARAIVLVVGRR